jgi:hypothetical protein
VDGANPLLADVGFSINAADIFPMKSVVPVFPFFCHGVFSSFAVGSPVVPFFPNPDRAIQTGPFQADLRIGKFANWHRLLYSFSCEFQVIIFMEGGVK